jgi:outer membrane lipoprotein LolB
VILQCSWLRALSVAAGVIVSGCASVAPPSTGPVLSGRIAVRVESQPVRNLSATFELSGNADNGRLALTGPLGSLMAEVRWTAHQAVLTTPDGLWQDTDLETLAANVLGERIPIAALYDWLRGRPWAQAGASPLPDAQVGFEQLGWQISLARFGSGLVEARRERPTVVSLRAQLDRDP